VGMPGRVVPWEISWRAVLGLGSFDSGSSWDVDVDVVFASMVAFGVATGVGSRIAEGAMIGVRGFCSFGVFFVS
jgi:hypothetical protein